MSKKDYDELIKPFESYKIISNNGEIIKIEIKFKDNPSIFREYKYLTPDKVYKMIESKHTVKLNNSYVKGLDIFNLERECLDKINFDARDAFFDGYVSFSNAKFGDGDVLFNNAKFGDGYVSFSNAKFGDGDVLFDNVKFGDGDVSFNNAEFGDGYVSFDNAKFGDGEVSFINAKFGDGKVLFTKANFGDGKISFDYVNFGNNTLIFNKAIFGNGNVCFDNAKFGNEKIMFDYVNFGNGEVSFSDIKFLKGNISFSNANFGDGNISFSGASFEDGIMFFINTNFGNGNVSFDYTNFGNGNVLFYRAYFGNGNVLFDNAKFGDGVVLFDDVNFGVGEISFKRTDFGNGKISFLQVVGDIISFINCKFLYHEDFRFNKVNELKIWDCIIDGTLNIKSTDDVPVDINKLSFKETRNLGRIEIDWHINKVKNLIINNEDKFSSKAEQFAMIKENYHNIGDYESEDLAYVEHKRCTMLSKLNREQKDREYYLKRYPIYICHKIVFDKLGGFGTKPRNVFRAILLTIFLFAVIYFAIPDFEIGTNENVYKGIISALYFSGTTFLTIGYGDIHPKNNWTSLFCVLEGFLGIFLVSYFTVSFARKLLR